MMIKNSEKKGRMQLLKMRENKKGTKKSILYNTTMGFTYPIDSSYSS